MRNVSRDLEENLNQFCAGGITGSIVVKLVKGEVVVRDETRKNMASGLSCGEMPIPLEACLAFVERLRREKIHGDVVFDVCAGRAVEIEVKKRYRAQSAIQYAYAGGTLNGKTSADY